MLTACGESCHASTSVGQQRHGAPVGLDFDVQPVRVSSDEPTHMLTVEKADLSVLANVQRTIFEHREEIWRAVVSGSMPYVPGGEAQRRAEAGTLFEASFEGCALGNKLGSVTSSSSRTRLREWLACGVPVVEAYGNLESPAGGSVGDQYPGCQP
jgi:hypothetical protein